MNKNTIKMIQDLTNKVDSILYDRNKHMVQKEKYEPIIVDPHIPANMPVTYLEVYHKLAEALPTIEDIFFCSPLTDKERKEKKFSCLKSSTIKYLPPAVNETASTTTKRADSVLYNLQATLANINMPIYLFVHQKLLNNAKKFNEDNNIVFVHTIRALLSDLATNMSQLRIDTAEAFNVLVKLKIKQEGLVYAGSFRGTSNSLISNTVAATLHICNKLKTLLQLPRLRRLTTRRQTINKFFAGGVAAEQSMGKDNKRSMIRTQFRVVIQNSDQEFESRQGRQKKSGIYIKGSEETKRTGISDKFKKIYTKSIKNFNSSSPKTFNVETSFRAQKQSTIDIRYMYINCHFYRACNTKLNALENPTKNMGQAVIFARDTRIGNAHIFR
ncbi:hypothetical protein BB561_003688 [Smittium simulii]|uniref:Uncharacterized protein n=1 Tax=Smittium simulii TaxID=133385 RepID=A0A2T9YK02_9FUNG|nr:hypothetical protein BB561_003688 [Smittium simulii]